MLKISESKRGRRVVTLRLEGQIVGPWVEELARVCGLLVNNGGRIALDLAEVVFVDDSGVAVLTRLSAQGVRLLNATPFVAAQLNGGGSRAARTLPA